MPWLALCNVKGLNIKVNIPVTDCYLNISEMVKFLFPKYL